MDEFKKGYLYARAMQSFCFHCKRGLIFFSGG